MIYFNRGDNLKIKKIAKVKDDKYIITFENDEIIETFDDVILKYRLLPKKDVDIKLFTNIELDTNIDKTYFKVVKMVSKKMKSKKEISDYIDSLEINDYEKNIIIDKLITNKIIDDLRFAKAYAFDRFNLSSDGVNLIRKKLIDFGIESNYIEEALDTIKEIDVLNKLDRLMKKKISYNTKYSDYILKQKVYEYFINLGYDSNDIINSFEKNKLENNTIEKSYLKIIKKLSKKYSGEELELNIRKKLYSLGYNNDEINSVLKNSS